jgi:peptidoglycan/LPS O-acetylase OafA/YrhL
VTDSAAVPTSRRVDNGRIDEFESLRGLMALWVVLGHVALTFDLPAFKDNSIWRVLGENGRAVNVFIVLSGFVIFYLIDAKRERYDVYIARRFLRIFPAYLVCLTLSVAMLYPSIEGLLGIDGQTGRNANRIAIFMASLAEFPAHLLAHLTLLHGVVPQRLLPYTDYAFIGQAWSISVEWQFYLLAPTAFFLATMRNRLFGLPLLAVLCALLWKVRIFFGLGFMGGHIVYFIVGCASFIFWRSSSKYILKISSYTGFIMLFVTLFFIFLRPQEWELAIWFYVLLGCNAMRFQNPGPAARAISGALLTKAARWLGKRSYSIYLVHMVILYGILYLISDADWSPMVAMSVTMVLTLAGTLFAAGFLYRFVEAPFIAMGRRLSDSAIPFPSFSKTK